jgi:hypothetical protein
MKWLLALLLTAVVAAVPQGFDTDCKPDQWGLAAAPSHEKLSVKMVAKRAEWTEGLFTLMEIPPGSADTVVVRIRTVQQSPDYLVLVIEDAVTDSVYSMGVLLKAHKCGYHTESPGGIIIFEPLIKTNSGYDFKKLDP